MPPRPGLGKLCYLWKRLAFNSVFRPQTQAYANMPETMKEADSSRIAKKVFETVKIFVRANQKNIQVKDETAAH